MTKQPPTIEELVTELRKAANLVRSLRPDEVEAVGDCMYYVFQESLDLTDQIEHNSKAGRVMNTGGLKGDYSDSCVVCLTGTDTGLAFVGEAEWAVAGLHEMGLSMDQARDTVTIATRCAPGKVPAGQTTVVVRSCAPCASKAGLSVGQLSDGQPIPSYGQRSGGR